MKDELIKILSLPNYTPFEIDYSLSNKQNKVNINGIDIHFPYQIYDIQNKYMEKIIELLNNRILSNRINIGALESPTGTGKTLCLLCSTLAWMNEMRKKKLFGGKIIYTTRTHSQISQVMQELRKTCYKPRTAVLSSRDHSCVNSAIRQNISGNILNIKCRKNCVKCAYYNGVLSDKRERNNMLDIEELFKNGKNQTFCPFYQQIEIAKSYSDIVFMPYNYIFDEDINNIMEIDFSNDIILIDEAHNIRKVCEDSKSIEIKSNDFDDIISDLNSFINIDEDNDEFIGKVFNFQSKNKNKKKNSILQEIPKNDIAKEKKAIEKIKDKFNQYQVKYYNKEKGQKITYDEFFKIFLSKEDISNTSNKKNKKNKKIKKIIKHKDDELSCDSNSFPDFNISENINVENLVDHISFLDKINMNFMEFFEKGSKITILIKILNIIKQLLENIILQKCYIFFMEEGEKETVDEETNEKINVKINKFSIFCFSPHLGFSDILNKNPFSIIFTSGTLTPFNLYENELNIKFDITFENEHIVPNEQINFNMLSNFEEGVFRFDYNNRNNNQMIKALGKVIIDYCKNVQNGGILVFFPSFYYLNECRKIWNEFGINKNIESYKKIYIDSSKDKHLITQIKDDSRKNYIFFSVFRGIASEGIDFSDDSARAVICIGIPFADYSDNKVKLKIEFLNNNQKGNSNYINGNEWYEADAMTAVNQSLGRVIRHKNDFGTLLCVDERFKRYEKYFSFWIREYLAKRKDDINMNINVNEFLNKNREKFKDIIEESQKIKNKNNPNLSGFNETIKIDSNIFQKNNNINKEKQNKEFEDDDNNEEEEIIEEEIINSNISSKEKENNSLKKIQNNNIFNFEQKREEKINTINIKEINYKTNYYDILKSINSESQKKKQKEKEKKENNKENELYEEWNISKNKKIEKKDNIFEKEEKQAKELLESLKLFAFNNPKELNNILNKYN